MRIQIFVRSRTRRRIAITARLLALILPAIFSWAMLAAEPQYPSITLHLKDVPLSDALRRLQGISRFGILFSDDVVKYGKPVSADIKNQELPAALKVIFEKQPFAYKISEKSVTVTYKPDIPNPKLSISKAVDTSITITGRVISDKGDPLAGATVMVKGTLVGAITDQNGNFALKSPSKGSTVIAIHNIGYTPKEMAVSGDERLHVTLAAATSSLDEIMALGYGSTSQRFNTGSISKISADKISTQPVGNVLTALEGRLPGVYISQNSGVPGSSINIVVRGIGGISSGSYPLYIIDGVPFTSTSIGSSSFGTSMLNGGNPMNAINPADIENIEVLKDADATSIYGSRGANGVVLITTKKGKSGKTKIDLSAYTGFSEVSRKLPLLNTAEYRQMRKEAFANDGIQPTAANAPDLLIWDSTKYTDWQNILLGGTGRSSDFQGSISGGNSLTQFMLGGGYHKETSVFPGNFGDARGAAHFNLTHSSENRKFKIALTASYSSDINNLFFTDLTGIAVILPPNAPDLIDKSGNLVWPQQIFFNPFSLEKQKYRATTNNFLASSQLGYQILPFLQAKVSGGFTRMTMDEINTVPLSSLNPSRNTADNTYSLFGNSSIQSWIIEPQLAFSKSVDNGILDATLGTTFQQDLNQGQTVQGTGYTNEALMESMAAASSVSVQNNIYTKYKYTALYARVNYNYKERYILNLTGRRDGSSRFGPGKQFGNFGSVGAAWIFSKESWLERSILSFGKIRASFGTTGNDRIGDYQYLSNWRPTSYPYNGVSGLRASNIAVADYSWEITKKLEAGIELGFWNNRLLLNADLYRNRSSNQLLYYNIPPSTGFSSITSNFPATIQNKGLEFTITSINILHKQFTWTSAINGTLPNNKLVAFPGLASSAYASTLVLGQPVTAVRTYHSTGVDPKTGLYAFQSATGGNTSTPSNPQDLLSNINLSPIFYGGFDNTIKYQNWTLDIFFQFVKQHGYRYTPASNPGVASNQPVTVWQRWQQPDDNASIQKFSTQSNASFAYRLYGLSDGIVEDASFMRLKNVQLSYGLPQSLLSKARLQMCELYCRVQNLFTITSFDGMDPEVNKNKSSALLPPLRTVVFGIQLSF